MVKHIKSRLDLDSLNLEDLSNSELKKIADYELRKFLIRGRTYIKCPIKNKVFSIRDMEVAHFIDRNCMLTRYDLNNCHLVSKQSNTWDAQVEKEGYKSKHHYDYEKYLGCDLVNELREKAKNIKIFYKEDYIKLINKFRMNE